ncbi:MAG: hypothetical protein AB7O62_02090 [Pirellulales bacterium]
MVHYTCDRCKREIDSDELRYTVKLEMSAAFDPLAADEQDDDRDHLREIQNILEQLDNSQEEEVCDEIHQEMKFDLCVECSRKVRKNPLGAAPAKKFEFSSN